MSYADVAAVPKKLVWVLVMPDQQLCLHAVALLLYRVVCCAYRPACVICLLHVLWELLAATHYSCWLMKAAGSALVSQLAPHAGNSSSTSFSSF
jgi:hypothetical protein